MLAISMRLRQSLGILISIILMRIDNSLVWDLVLVGALVVLAVLTVLTALDALTALVVFVAQIAPDAEEVAVAEVAVAAEVEAATKLVNRLVFYLRRPPALLQGVFSNEIRHNGQIAVHTMVVTVILNIYGHKG